MKNKNVRILLSVAAMGMLMALNSWGQTSTRQPQAVKQPGPVYSQIVSLQRIIYPDGSTNYYITRMNTNLSNSHRR